MLPDIAYLSSVVSYLNPQLANKVKKEEVGYWGRPQNPFDDNLSYSGVGSVQAGPDSGDVQSKASGNIEMKNILYLIK
jgi:hypothetical protein